ncbi:MAG: L,D-transpeptidase family protein [Parcubacteria group bacterium]
MYVTKEGDTLSKIAPKGSWPIIMKLNGIDPTNIQIGHEILIPADHNNIPNYCPVPQNMPHAQHEARKAFVFLNTQYFGAYEYGKLIHWGPISSGGKHPTKTGNFHIMAKHKNYFSHDPESYGAPMLYAQRLTERGIFFHHQNMPGKPASHGCIRLLMSDAAWLFTWTHEGDPVTISS